MEMLETERLILRKWSEADVEDMYEYAKHPNIGPRAGWPPHQTKEESLKIIQMFIKDDNDWAIEEKLSGKVIGSIGCRPDMMRKGVKAENIGYVLSADYWGKGFMPEAVNRVLAYCFDEKSLEIVSISHSTSNLNSRRVIEKCGFVYEGTLRQSLIFEGNVTDSLVYSMTKEDWQQKKKQF